MSFQKIWSPKGCVEKFYATENSRNELIEKNPGFHNLVSFEDAWIERPDEMDFLAETSLLFYQKMLSTRIYWDFIDSHLSISDSDSHVLDAACGIGRFAIGLAERFSKVTAFDPCLSSLRACGRHLEKRDIRNVDLNWADLSWLDELPENQFDAVLAIELICYATDPEKSLKRLVRAAAPGAKVIVSVEGTPGALTIQSTLGPADLPVVIEGKPLFIPYDRYVTFFTPQSLAKLMRDSGLKEIYIEGSHYMLEGPFWYSIDQNSLDDPGYRDQILEAERTCSRHPLLAPWGRVFSGVGTV